VLTCTNCGRLTPETVRFCQECGQRTAPRVVPPTPPVGVAGAPMPTPAELRVATAQGIGLGLPMASAENAPQPDRRCNVCDTPNAGNLRYCSSCGATLASAHAGASAPPTGAASAPPIERAPHPAEPAPVAAEGAARACSRCAAAAEPSAQFCKFCGAHLGTSSTSEPPLTLPIAPLTNAAAAPATVPASAASTNPATGPEGAAKFQHGTAAILARSPSSSAARGRLVVIAKTGADGQSYPLGAQLDLGRLEGDVIFADDLYVSPRHARLVWQEGRLLLRDLASTNGIYVRLMARDPENRPRAEGTEASIVLSDHDHILVGQQVLRFETVSDAEAGLGPAREHGTLVFGSPTAPRYARLSQRTVEGTTRDIFTLRRSETVLGRESGDLVFTDDPFLSRRHAAIRMKSRDGSSITPGCPLEPGEAVFTLVDLGSSNGTFIRIRGDVELHAGDHFRIGQQLFRVDLEGARW
jgi:pSer/pThr/pTyr-binding forkhead associated (FHA) protein